MPNHLTTEHTGTALSERQQALLPIAALGAMGELQKLEGAFTQGLRAGLSISEIKEVLIQLYAYAGFPPSLNAMAQFMDLVNTRKAEGEHDALGMQPNNPVLTGEALLNKGTATQTALCGAPVEGPLFQFAPSMNVYLKTHLFGDILSRDNLGWQDRELATLGMLSGLTGVEPQLKHISKLLETLE